MSLNIIFVGYIRPPTKLIISLTESFIYLSASLGTILLTMIEVFVLSMSPKFKTIDHFWDIPRMVQVDMKDVKFHNTGL